MSDNKKYYYLKLKENFFDTDELRLLESMPNGYMYSNLLLKLYLKSLKYLGKLKLNEYIPYNPEMIATVTNLNIDVVRSGLRVLENLKLIDVLPDGTIFMMQIQNFIGKSSSEADRKRKYREQIEEEKKNLLTDGQMSGQSEDKCPTERDKTPPEIELEKEKEKEIELNKISWKDILKAWNSLPTPIKQVKAITDKRKDKIKARTNSLNLKTEDIIQAINNINKSDFCKGNNNKGWIIDFDWLFQDDTRFSKVLEGKYNNAESDKKQNTSNHSNKKESNFNNFKGRDYDFDDLEKKLLGWDK